MELLTEMILQMDKHAARQYKVFAGRANDDTDRKDITLFDFIRKNGIDYQEDKIFKKLYVDSDKNAFYRLKNRLMSDISRSVFLHQHSTNDNMLCFYYMALGWYYQSVNVPKVAYHFFKKGEQLSKEMENYGLLDIIYSHIIKLAREIQTINPEQYIKKRKDNRALLSRLSEVEDILAVFEYRMNTAQNLANTSIPIPELLENTLNEYTHDDELKQSPKLKFGIYFIVSHILLQSKNYPALIEYLISTYNSFQDKRFFNKSNHQHKLQMLAWIANSAFMNKNYQLSLQYADLLHAEMLAFDKLHYDLFELFYYNIQVLNFSKINPEKAISLLQSLSKIKSIQQNAFYAAFTFLNLAEMHFILKKYSQAIVNLNKAYTHDGYKSIDNQVKLRANIGELMIRYDMKEFDFLEYRIKQILKDNKDYLSELAVAKENIFLQFMQKLSEDQGAIKKAQFRVQIKKYLEEFEKEWTKEEVLFRYNEWLENKL
jgi:hypothetical protein